MMSEIDERLAEIQARVEKAAFHKAGEDLRYLLDLATSLRVIKADLALERQEWKRVAEVRLGRIEALRQQLTAHDEKASAACQEWGAKCQEVEALVPEVDLIERATEMMWHTCESCPTLRVRCPGYQGDRAEGLCSTLTKELKELAIRIRAWRKSREEE
jgi:hypothetical protein